MELAARLLDGLVKCVEELDLAKELAILVNNALQVVFDVSKLEHKDD